MSDEYILPSEFASLVAFWFGPPLLIALTVQIKVFASRGRSTGRLARGLVLAGTPVASIILGLVLLVASPAYFRFLGVTDLNVAGHIIPFLPSAYVAVLLVAVLFTWIATRRL